MLRHRRSPATLRNARESKQAGKHTHTHVQCRSRPPSKIASHSVQDLMAYVTRKALTHHAAAAGVFAASNFAQRASGTRQLLGHEIPAPHGPHRHSSTRLSVVACPTVYIIARRAVAGALHFRGATHVASESRTCLLDLGICGGLRKP